jgi:hypothetical protein
MVSVEGVLFLEAHQATKSCALTHGYQNTDVLLPESEDDCAALLLDGFFEAQWGCRAQ